MRRSTISNRSCRFEGYRWQFCRRAGRTRREKKPRMFQMNTDLIWADAQRRGVTGTRSNWGGMNGRDADVLRNLPDVMDVPREEATNWWEFLCQNFQWSVEQPNGFGDSRWIKSGDGPNAKYVGRKDEGEYNQVGPSAVFCSSLFLRGLSLACGIFTHRNKTILGWDSARAKLSMRPRSTRNARKALTAEHAKHTEGKKHRCFG